RTTVDLDGSDDDNNANTPVTIDADDGDFLFTDDAGTASYTIIQNFEEGDAIQVSDDFEATFTTAAGDPNSLEITFNNDGVVSQIILEDVVGDDAGFIFDEATAEAAVGFDFFSNAMAAADQSVA
ncbi:hypothetical protein RM533_12375, partial [Croceicoccus sp. F390]